MSVVPYDLFLFSQIFGMFPLVYTEQSNQKMRVEFSAGLFLKCLLVITFLTVTSYLALYADYTGYLAGRPIRMSNSTFVLTVIADVSLLNLMAVAIFYGAARSYPAFSAMCDTLQRIDRTLRLRIHHPWLRVKMVAAFLHVTGLIVITSVLRHKESPAIWLYVPFWTTYYIAASLLLQFNFAIQTLTQRFETINGRLEEEVMKQTFEQLLIVDLGLSKSNVNIDGPPPVYRLKVMTDSYTELFGAVQQANSFYRSQVLATVSSSLIHNIITLYFLILDLQRPVISYLVLGQFAWALSRVLHIILLLWPCATLSRAAGETGPVVCQLLNRDLLNPDIAEELKLFLLKLRHFRVEFSALGFFPIHRNILTSIASSVATYLVVMLQLEGSSSNSATGLTNYFGQVLATVSSSLIHNIITLYFLILDLQRPVISYLVLGQFAWALSRVLHIILLLWPCATLSRAASETGPVVCQLLNRDLLNPDITEELKLFLLKLRHFRVEFSALGFFPIHRNILTSIASSVATYLVVMLQLEGSSSNSAVSNGTVTTSYSH